MLPSLPSSLPTPPLPLLLFLPSTQHLQSIKTVGGSHLNLAEEVITSLATSNNNFRASLKSVRDHYVNLHHVTFSQCDILNQASLVLGLIEDWMTMSLHKLVHVILYRLFSEGGNYCPEEVEVYSKRMVS